MYFRSRWDCLTSSCDLEICQQSAGILLIYTEGIQKCDLLSCLKATNILYTMRDPLSSTVQTEWCSQLQGGCSQYISMIPISMIVGILSGSVCVYAIAADHQHERLKHKVNS